ncbi:SRPBCC domain-containing protein [Paractinoplanes lichenicola]|uniref:SRPBCC domain-containing protein n=1 Tax=Paractinoplanes lichenicola TaxID=2802976 RepID=A0ABS1VDL5_9ACTN|nr:SRPBCC domain-containing protein [Actinoplanes lichenicola]MBL7252783.1 SRPBCC domain-containing protein [Actinoplanes lichenicola]
MNPDLDLSLQRIIRAPRAKIWQAWTDPAKFARWFMPAPSVLRVDRLEVRPGGGLVTRMSDDGVDFVPHLDAVFLLAEELERIVFTNALDSSWRPADAHPVPLTAEMTFADHPDGTDYRVLVRHGDPAARKRHEELGFAEGWGTVTEQLAAAVEAPGGQATR